VLCCAVVGLVGWLAPLSNHSNAGRQHSQSLTVTHSHPQSVGLSLTHSQFVRHSNQVGAKRRVDDDDDDDDNDGDDDDDDNDGDDDDDDDDNDDDDGDCIPLLPSVALPGVYVATVWPVFGWFRLNCAALTYCGLASGLFDAAWTADRCKEVCVHRSDNNGQRPPLELQE